jgi:hypothetical protein
VTVGQSVCRVECPECGRLIGVRSNGSLYRHIPHSGEEACWTSGLTVEQAEAEIQESLARFRRVQEAING